jgi:hypothetical protein
LGFWVQGSAQNQAGQTWDSAQQGAGDAANQAGNAAGSTWDSAQQGAGNAANQAGNAAGSTWDSAQQGAQGAGDAAQNTWDSANQGASDAASYGQDKGNQAQDTAGSAVNQVYISIYPLAPRTLPVMINWCKKWIDFVEIKFHLLWEHLNDIASNWTRIS